MAYETTTVPVERSQGEIRKLLAGHGAARFAFGEETDTGGVRWAAVSFAHDRYAVRIRVPHKPVDERALRSKVMRARSRTREEIAHEMAEQEARRIWRVMAWNLKARLVAVEEGVETFEEAFLAHILDERTGRTIYEQLADDGRVELARPLPALPSGAGQ
jgi:hypothetical protein